MALTLDGTAERRSRPGRRCVLSGPDSRHPERLSTGLPGARRRPGSRWSDQLGSPSRAPRAGPPPPAVTARPVPHALARSPAGPLPGPGARGVSTLAGMSTPSDRARSASTADRSPQGASILPSSPGRAVTAGDVTAKRYRLQTSIPDATRPLRRSFLALGTDGRAAIDAGCTRRRQAIPIPAGRTTKARGRWRSTARCRCSKGSRSRLW